VPIELMDGQTWFLPRPRLRFRAVQRDGKIEAGHEHSFGPEYLVKVEAYHSAGEDETPGSLDRFASALLDLSISLLQRNYDLRFEEAASLFWFEFTGDPDPKIALIQETFTRTALGIGSKKTSPDGSLPT
jgi:hypothetical protein